MDFCDLKQNLQVFAQIQSSSESIKFRQLVVGQLSKNVLARK